MSRTDRNDRYGRGRLPEPDGLHDNGVAGSKAQCYWQEIGVAFGARIAYWIRTNGKKATRIPAIRAGKAKSTRVLQWLAAVRGPPFWHHARQWYGLCQTINTRIFAARLRHEGSALGARGRCIPIRDSFACQACGLHRGALRPLPGIPSRACRRNSRHIPPGANRAVDFQGSGEPLLAASGNVVPSK